MKEVIILLLIIFLFPFFSFSQTAVFNYSGAVQIFVVPAFVTTVDLDVRGAEGSPDGGGLGVAGKGGRVQASLIVIPGDTLYIYVGGTGAAPAGGFNGGGHGGTSSVGPAGGGGGGMSDVRQGGDSLSNIVVAAAGGGGCGGYNGVNGGDGGGLTGQPGTDGAAIGGQGGTQVSGGLAGTGAGNCGLAGTSGLQWAGGTGGNTTCGNGFGGGGGGGAGYFGGGGGGAAAYLTCCPDWSGGGGGGSSYVDSAATLIAHTPGYQSGNGQVTISYILTGTAEIENIDNEITLSPNPASNQFTIYSLRFTISEIEIYDLFGKIIHIQQQTTNLPATQQPSQWQAGDKQQTVDVSQLPSGIYFVSVKTNDIIKITKFVKQ